MTPSSMLAVGLALAWKSCAVMGVAAIVTLSMRRASAALRHLVWTLALGGVLLLPAFARLVPPRPVAVVPHTLAGRWRPLAAPAATRAPDRDARVQTAPAGQGRVAAARGESTDRGPSLAEPGSSSGGALPVWIALWIAGALAVLTRIVVGYLLLRRSTHGADPITSGPWRTLLRRLSSTVGLGTPPALLRLSSTAMPMTWGLMRPAVLLPEGADAWPDARREVVLLHELAHVRRRDCLTQALAQLACAVYWFNPLVWVAARRLRAERELACDDLVLRHGATGPTYATELLELARSLRDVRGGALATVAMARRTQLEGRLLAILNPSQNRAAVGRPLSTALAAASLVALVPIAAVVPVAGAVGPGSPEAAGPAAERRDAWPAPAAVAPSSAPAPDPRQGADTAEPQMSGTAVDALIAALKDPDAEVRRAAASALGDLRDRRALAGLTAAVNDESAGVRRAAIGALGDLRDRRAVPALIAALSDENADVRRTAASALGDIRDPSATDALSAAMKDADPDVRRAAIAALAELTKSDGFDPNPNPNPDPNPNPRPRGGGVGKGRGLGFGAGQGSGKSLGRAIWDGAFGGIEEGISHGIESGIPGGIDGSVDGGISGGVKGGVAGGIDADILGGVRSGDQGPLADVTVTQKHLVLLAIDGKPLTDGARRCRLTLEEHSLTFTMRNEPRSGIADADPGVATVTFAPEAGHRYEVEIRGPGNSYATRVWTKGEWKPVVRDRTTDRIVSTEPVWSGTGTRTRDDSVLRP